MVFGDGLVGVRNEIPTKVDLRVESWERQLSYRQQIVLIYFSSIDCIVIFCVEMHDGEDVKLQF